MDWGSEMLSNLSKVTQLESGKTGIWNQNYLARWRLDSYIAPCCPLERFSPKGKSGPEGLWEADLIHIALLSESGLQKPDRTPWTEEPGSLQSTQSQRVDMAERPKIRK